VAAAGSACAPETEEGSGGAAVPPGRLGPRDGPGLAPTDLQRVAVGTPAPDFSLMTLDGDTVTLSDFRGRTDVVLVFYRGHW
jgi:hypothetical protein